MTTHLQDSARLSIPTQYLHPKYADNEVKVNIVLEYLASLSPANVLSFYTLTLNFVTLLCLLSGQRVQTLQQICLEDCAVTDGVLRIKHSNFKDHKTRKSRR
jgi:hypothetical protein